MILRFLTSIVFQSYAVISLAIGAAILYEVLFVFYSYLNDDTETATFDHPILVVGYVASGAYEGCVSSAMERLSWVRDRFHVSCTSLK